MSTGAFRRDALIVALLALALGAGMAALIRNPGYTDAYYYFNAGQRLIQGKGLTDAAIWTYIGAPAGLPIPSHLYWMPLTSLVAAGGMALGGPTFEAAQIPFVALYAALAVVGFWLGAAIGGTRRTAWLAGLLVAFSGFFMPYWTTTATFAPFGLAGSLALITMGLGRRAGDWRWFAASGVLAALAHLTRADGLLFLGALLVVALWPVSGQGWRRGVGAALAGLAAYLLVMAPWFARNLSVAGTILPAGGLETAWMRSYDEIVNYPPGADLVRFLAWGPQNILASCWEALVTNFQTFLAVEGWVAVAPLMLIGLWRRRREPLLSGFWLYAVGLHAAMTLVFAFPGPRGGLLHSASALLPFWAALGVAGLDDALAWAAARRRWKLKQAKRFFGAALVIMAVALSAAIFFQKAAEWGSAGQIYDLFARIGLPDDAVVMLNDPSALYYFTGRSGVVLPNAPPAAIYDLSQRYGVNFVVLDKNYTAPMVDLWERRSLPFFLRPFYSDPTIRIYKVRREGDIDEPK